ncbi:MAG: ParA family protein [Clostridia bacterium]|nr:ParA family protein [Clostridia bacterium]
MKSAKIISIINQKGGVGKTTTAVNYGIGLARKGKKVLLVDADSQGSLTVSLGEHDLTALDITLASLMYGIVMNRPIDPHLAILHHREGVDFIPSNYELSGVSTALTSLSNREFILKTILDSLREEYDYILIDCLPSLGLLAINALVAADSVIIPCQPAYLPTKGLNILLRTIAKIRRALNPELQIDGILLTCADVHTKNAKEIMQSMRDSTNVRIFDTVIPRSVKVAECSIMGKSIYTHNRTGKVTEAYEQLIEEVLSYGI